MPEHRVDAYAASVLAGTTVAGPYVRLACERHVRDMARAAREPDWYQFSADRADHVLTFIEECLRLPDVLEDDEPAPFRLLPWQVFVAGSLFGWVDAQGARRFREAYIETGKGSGKALALDTPIPTPTGWTTMGAIRVGDQVFDESGRVVDVTGAFDVLSGHPCYEVVFDDGSTIVADEEHLWWTEQRTFSKRGERLATSGVTMSARGSWRRGIRTTGEIRNTLRYSNGKYQSANHSIPLAGPLGTIPAALPIHPYALGVWLGDGDSDCNRITVDDADAELLEHVAACGVAVGERKQSIVAPRAPRYRIGGGGDGPSRPGMKSLLRTMGVLQNKHIPAVYLRASVDQRLALLQGLMDTDGYIDKASGSCEFTSTKEALATGALELIHSLGIKAAMRERPAKLHGRVVSSVWRILFYPPSDLPIFRLRRKLQYQAARHSRRRLSGERRIVDVRPVPSVPVRCIAVASRSHLYLAGRSMVPTHNTPLAAAIGLYGLMMDGERAAEIYAAAANQDQASVLFRHAIQIAQASADVRSELKFDGKDHVWQIRHPESLSFFRTFTRESGQKSGTRPHMGMLDELHEHPSAETTVKIRAGAKRRPQPLFFEITNAGFDRTSVCWQRHEHARKVVEQAMPDEQLFSYVCALDADDDPLENDGCWIKTNPSLPITPSMEYLRRQVANAKNLPSEYDTNLRLNFCVWTRQHTRAIDMKRWLAAKPMPTPAELLTAEWFGCFDMGETDDFTACGRIGLLADGRVAVHFHYFVPEAAVTRYPHRPYGPWERLGLLTITEGDVVDYEVVRDWIRKDCAAHGIKTVFFDQHTAKETAQLLMVHGLDLVKIPQGTALHEAINRFLALVASGDLCHGDDPILTWMASNLVIKPGNLKRLDKARDAEKIDGISALVTGIEGALVRRARVEPAYQMLFVGGR